VTSIAILGAGAWGTALAIKLSQRFAIRLWGRDGAQIAALESTRSNQRYLPGVTLPFAIEPTSDLDVAVSGADCCVVATPVNGLMPTIAALPDRSVPLFWLCKGFVFAGGGPVLPHHLVASAWRGGWGLLSGPSFAQEVAANAPTAPTAIGRLKRAFAPFMLASSDARISTASRPSRKTIVAALKTIAPSAGRPAPRRA